MTDPATAASRGAGGYPLVRGAGEHPLIRGAGLLAAAGAAAVAYATLVERQWFALRPVTVPVLASGERPLTVLHLSDLHILPGQRHKSRWVAALAALEPDLTVFTGDALSSKDSVAPTVSAFGALLDRPGAFVFGNNDFYAPTPKSPHRYFTRRTQVRRAADLPWRELGEALVARGWADLNNTRAIVTTGGADAGAIGFAGGADRERDPGRRRIALAGVNDPHTRRDRYELIAGPAVTDAAVRIGVTHSPEPHILDALAADGYDVTLAGHTHGGQVRLPGLGALVTNCGLDRSRARGLSRWGARMWLHVSAGLGNSPYMPVRFCCRPEATLLTLVPRS